jgi:hypothetical protein
MIFLSFEVDIPSGGCHPVKADSLNQAASCEGAAIEWVKHRKGQRTFSRQPPGMVGRLVRLRVSALFPVC